MPIRLVGIDLDGTLLNSRSEISPANRQALAEATACGVQVVVVTGRRSHSARKFVEAIPCPITLISSNGALATSPSGEVLHRNFLPRATARRVLEISREFRPYTAAIYHEPGRGQVLLEQSAVPAGPLGWYLTNSPDCFQQVNDLESALTADPIQILFGGPPATIEPAEPLLRSSPIGADIHLTWTKYLLRDISLLDVMNAGCTKGAALALWAEQCGIAAGEVMAIGDNFNDLEMLQFAGLPVVMGNHSPGFGEAHWTLTLSNDQDGVAAAIRTHVLQ
ncbi:MAG TPA: HAD family hydrolase [Terriglobia bacterium]|nr:HAD family hydrolase [Terriglobia bacterium]